MVARSRRSASMAFPIRTRGSSMTSLIMRWPPGNALIPTASGASLYPGSVLRDCTMRRLGQGHRGLGIRRLEELGRPRRDERSNWITQSGFLDRRMVTDVEDYDWQTVVAKQRERRHVHDLQISFNRLLVADSLVAARRRITVRIRGIDTVDTVLGHQQDIG